MRLHPTTWTVATLLALGASSCAQRGLHPTTSAEVGPMPIEDPDAHQLGLGRWFADFSRTDSLAGVIHVVGIIDLDAKTYTVPMEQLLGRPLRAGAIGQHAPHGFRAILGQARDTFPNGGYSTYTHDGSVRLGGRWVSRDSLVGDWYEWTYMQGRRGVVVLVRCDRGAPSNSCMQPTRAPSH